MSIILVQPREQTKGLLSLFPLKPKLAIVSFLFQEQQNKQQQRHFSNSFSTKNQ